MVTENVVHEIEHCLKLWRERRGMPEDSRRFSSTLAFRKREKKKSNSKWESESLTSLHGSRNTNLSLHVLVTMLMPQDC